MTNDENNLKKMLANPYYAIVIAKNLSEDHEPLIAEEDWVKANAKLIQEIGAEEWLHRLLDVLKGE
jgi:hypothetical protein